MIYLKVSKSNYKTVELKEDITTALSSWHSRLNLPSIQSYIWNLDEANSSLSTGINEKFSDIRYSDDPRPMQMERDENFHPGGNAEAYRYEISGSNLIETKIE